MSDKVETIRMRREEPAHEGGPTTADVHPDEVANWAASGWEREVTAPPQGEGGELKLEEMKRPQLVEVAARYSVTLVPGMSNVQAVAAIRAAAGYAPQGEGSEGQQQ